MPSSSKRVLELKAPENDDENNTVVIRDRQPKAGRANNLLDDGVWLAGDARPSLHETVTYTMLTVTGHKGVDGDDVLTCIGERTSNQEQSDSEDGRSSPSSSSEDSDGQGGEEHDSETQDKVTPMNGIGWGPVLL